MKFKLTLILALCFSAAQAQTISLSQEDQNKLTRELSKIDLAYRTREVVQESPYLIVENTYKFLTEQDAFFIHCSEKFVNASTVGTEASCKVGFNYDASVAGEIEAHDGFMPEFSVVQINNPVIARTLYKAIGNGVSPSVFFNSKEQIVFTHPATGQKFPAFKLRVDCKRDANYKAFSCIASAIK